jgi:hypothetical protein
MSSNSTNATSFSTATQNPFETLTMICVSKDAGEHPNLRRFATQLARHLATQTILALSPEAENLLTEAEHCAASSLLHTPAMSEKLSQYSAYHQRVSCPSPNISSRQRLALAAIEAAGLTSPLEAAFQVLQLATDSVRLAGGDLELFLSEAAIQLNKLIGDPFAQHPQTKVARLVEFAKHALVPPSAFGRPAVGATC